MLRVHAQPHSVTRTANLEQALIQQFEEDQMERLALARAQNEQTLNTIRDRAAVDLGRPIGTRLYGCDHV